MEGLSWRSEKCPVARCRWLKYAASHGGCQLTLLRQFVTATCKLTKALCVEYIAAAEDGLGRLYARQVSAQSLSRDARYLLYGQTHKEVDMSGAHYEILRRVAGASFLPTISQLREAINTDCQGSGDDFLSFVKLLPLRLLNTGAARTLSYAREQGYHLSDYTASIFREIETLRDIHMPKILGANRQELAVSFRNRNYHACETAESQFMHTFYRSLCTREQISSAIWLHDGMWVNQEVSDSAIRIAETDALNIVFPGYRSSAAVFRIVSLVPRFVEIRDRLSILGPGPPILPAPPRKFAHLLTGQHPSAHFYQKFLEHHAEDKQDRYIDRVSKRPRL